MTENEQNKEEEKVSKDDIGKDTNNKSVEDASIIPDEILEAIPFEDRSRFKAIVQETMVSSISKRTNPIADKITSEHITQLISKSDEQDKRDRAERKGQRNYNLTLIIIGLLFVGFLIVFLQQNTELLIKIIVAIISFVGGFGLGKSTAKKVE